MAGALITRRMSVLALGALGGLALGAGIVHAQLRVATAACSASQLGVEYVNTTGAMGSRDGEYGFKNIGMHACTLSGYPDVQMLTHTGAKLKTLYGHAAPGAMGITLKTVSLAHAAVAYFDIHYASQTGFGNLSCPTSAALRLTAPGQMVGEVLHGKGGAIQPYGGSQTHLECGTVRVTPVTATRFQ
jgi:hypothetical protein